MKTKDKKKFNKTLALSLVISILFALNAGVIAVDSDYIVGGVSAFNLMDEVTGINILGTILNKSASKDIASSYNPYVHTRLDFSNIKIYIDGGTSVDWDMYYWRASSLNQGVAEVTGEHKITGETAPVYSNNVYYWEHFFRIDVKSVGTTVINVEVAATADMQNSLTKTFTVKVIDDSKDGEVRANFQKNSNGEDLDLNYELRISMTETLELSIMSVIGYDYSNLNSSFEQVLNSYSWEAEVFNKTGSAKISDSSTGMFLDNASSSVSVENGTGNKILYVNPVKEGTVDIVFTIIPDENQNNKKYIASTQTVKLYITKVVGNIEVTPTSKIYGANTPYNEIYVEFENFRVKINGEDKDIAELVNNNASLTAYITVDKDKISELRDSEAWQINPANMNQLKCAVDINSEFLKNPVVNVPLIKDAYIEIIIEGLIYNEYKSIYRNLEIKFALPEDDGKIALLNFKSGEEPVYQGESLEGKIDKDGKALEKIILNSFELEIYDSENSSNGFKRLLNYNGYIIKAEAGKSGIVNISVDNDSKKIIITPVQAGNTSISVVAEILETGEIFVVQFNFASVNIGILPEDEGKIISVELKRDGQNQKIYTGDNKTLYIKDNVQNYEALTINIDEVTITSNTAGSGYAEELLEYKWEIFQNYPQSQHVRHYNNYGDYIYYSANNMLSIEKTSGLSDNNGKADIKIGTERIFGETGNITVTIKITPVNNTDNIEEIKKSFIVEFKVVVNEIGGKFIPEIDYNNERIRIVMSKTGNDKGYYVFSGELEYMFCLQAAETGLSQSGEKWYPFMGSYIDISGFIPKNGTEPFRIAIKPIVSETEEDGNYSADIRKIVNLYPRRTVTSSERKAILYRDGKIIFDGLDDGVEYIFYKVGLSDYARAEINAYNGIDVSLKSNPLGAVVTIKFAAKTDSYNEENNRFASAEFKVAAPKTVKMPLIKDNKKKKYTGFTDKMLWSSSGNFHEDWTCCSKGAVLYENLRLAFPDLEIDKSGNFYNLYIKTAATAKALESEILILKIPADKYER